MSVEEGPLDLCSLYWEEKIYDKHQGKDLKKIT